MPCRKRKADAMSSFVKVVLLAVAEISLPAASPTPTSTSMTTTTIGTAATSATSAAPYEIHPRANTCPLGQERITSQRECSAAAWQLGMSYGGSGSYSHLPSGCYTYSDSELWLNSHPTGSTYTGVGFEVTGALVCIQQTTCGNNIHCPAGHACPLWYQTPGLFQCQECADVTDQTVCENFGRRGSGCEWYQNSCRVTQATKYSIGATETTTCSSGLQRVEVESECADAAAELGFAYQSSNIGAGDVGCMLSAGTIHFIQQAGSAHPYIAPVCKTAPACPMNVAMRGASYQLDKMGSYTKTGLLQEDRPIYKQDSGDNYLYYWAAYETWGVGTNYTNATARVTASYGTHRRCPTDVTTWWQLKDRKWIEDAAIACKEVPNAPASGGTCGDPDPATDGAAYYICPSGYNAKSPAEHGGKCTDVFTCKANCCEEASYVYGSTSSNACPSGFRSIDTEEACRSAALSLGHTYNSAWSWPSYTGGCFQWLHNGQVYFNRLAGAAHANGQKVCQQASFATALAMVLTSTTTTTTIGICGIGHYQTSHLAANCDGDTGGSFSIEVKKGQVESIFQFPVGTSGVRIHLSATVDTDLQLIDVDTGVCVVGFRCSNVQACDDTTKPCIHYKEMSIYFSGDDAVSPVEELIEIDGLLTTNVSFALFGYGDGHSTISYSYGNFSQCSDPAPGCASCGDYEGCSSSELPWCNGGFLVTCAELSCSDVVSSWCSDGLDNAGAVLQQCGEQWLRDSVCLAPPVRDFSSTSRESCPSCSCSNWHLSDAALRKLMLFPSILAIMAILLICGCKCVQFHRRGRRALTKIRQAQERSGLPDDGCDDDDDAASLSAESDKVVAFDQSTRSAYPFLENLHTPEDDAMQVHNAPSSAFESSMAHPCKAPQTSTETAAPIRHPASFAKVREMLEMSRNHIYSLDPVDLIDPDALQRLVDDIVQSLHVLKVQSGLAGNCASRNSQWNVEEPGLRNTGAGSDSPACSLASVSPSRSKQLFKSASLKDHRSVDRTSLATGMPAVAGNTLAGGKPHYAALMGDYLKKWTPSWLSETCDILFITHHPQRRPHESNTDWVIVMAQGEVIENDYCQKLLEDGRHGRYAGMVAKLKEASFKPKTSPSAARSPVADLHEGSALSSEQPPLAREYVAIMKDYLNNWAPSWLSESCDVMIIAHNAKREPHEANADWVTVLNRGDVVENGYGQKLLEDEQGRYAGMVAKLRRVDSPTPSTISSPTRSFHEGNALRSKQPLPHAEQNGSTGCALKGAMSQSPSSVQAGSSVPSMRKLAVTDLEDEVAPSASPKPTRRRSCKNGKRNATTSFDRNADLDLVSDGEHAAPMGMFADAFEESSKGAHSSQATTHSSTTSWAASDSRRFRNSLPARLSASPSCADAAEENHIRHSPENDHTPHIGDDKRTVLKARSDMGLELSRSDSSCFRSSVLSPGSNLEPSVNAPHRVRLEPLPDGHLKKPLPVQASLSFPGRY